MNRLLATGGLPPVDKTVPPKVVMVAGWIFQTVFRLFNVKKEPSVTTFVAKQMSTSHWCDISAAKRDFGYVPEISIDEGMHRLTEWVSEAGPHSSEVGTLNETV